ncbi:hypothetical protein J1N35_030889 [Gossypium stocksii]|uniref:HMA domain-containing protein n=1 Tax=Gossypium stocksii TaxID=47602 RepID=A0A9D3ZUK0_9ROSI|nr:hypothetical protein J1N35_030889 [Gossypium stocksii]
MLLKVDLQCCRCYMKVKKVVSKFPQIRNQIYHEKANTVTITVVCCNPEKLRDKLWCKGGGSVKSIEIKPPAKRASPPREPTGKQESPPPTSGPLAGYCCTECYHGQRGGPCYFGVPPPPPCFWSYGRPVYDRWGGGGYEYSYASRGDCFREENPQACSAM